MRTMLMLAVFALGPLPGCTTAGSASSEPAKAEPATAEPKAESWLEKTGKNAEKEAKKLKEKGLPYYNECKAEVDKFCKTEAKELAKLGDCMKANKDKFTPACKAAAQRYMDDHK